jgi:hypothetical protein
MTYHPAYMRRQRSENMSLVHLLPLPPVQRTFMEMLLEWQDEWMNHDRLLIIMMIMMFCIQFSLMMGFQLAYRYYKPLKWSKVIFDILVCVFGFCRLGRLPGEGDRPQHMINRVFLPIIHINN